MDSQRLKQPLEYYRLDYCSHCNRNAIEAFDYFNRPLDYAKAIAMRGSFKFRNPIYSMRCKACGTRYKIRYEEDGFPIPYENLNLIKPFMGTYKDFWLENERKYKNI